LNLKVGDAFTFFHEGEKDIICVILILLEFSIQFQEFDATFIIGDIANNKWTPDQIGALKFCR
jgi:hypothetical protein